jgi:hypothetical protein
VHLILDEYATHKQLDVQQCLKRRKRFRLHLRPTSSWWLSLVERWFRELSDRAPRRGSFSSLPELITAIENYLGTYNEDPQPFVWTAAAESTLQKVRPGSIGFESVSQRRDTTKANYKTVYAAAWCGANFEDSS